MNETPLTKLRDIHLPPDIGMWPPAYGWYIIIAGLGIIIGLVLIWAYKRHQLRKPKIAAIKELEQIEKDYLLQKDVPKTAGQLISLVKRFNFSYGVKRKKIAPLYGKSLSEYFNNEPWVKEIATLSYMKTADVNLKPMFADIKRWIWHSQLGAKHV